MRNLKTVVAALAGAAALAVAAPAAEAAFVLTLTDGVNTYTATDEGVNDGAPGTPGMVVANAAVGSFIVNVSTGISKPIFPSSSNFAKMDLNSVNVSSTAAGGSLWIYLTDTDFFSPYAGTLRGHVGGTTNGTVDFYACKDANNQSSCGPRSDTYLALGPFSAGASGTTAFSADGSDPHGVLGDYSMTLAAHIVHGAGVKSTSFDFEVTNVPEPASMLLLGMGMLGAGAFARRRR